MRPSGGTPTNVAADHTGAPVADGPAAAAARSPGPTDGAEPALSPQFRLGHRRELDGLRGIAILIVVAYHVGRVLWSRSPEWMMRGGFLGVDLFFALSGFLITAVLLGEADRRGGRVALGSFAARRLRRLLPALVALLAAMWALALAGKFLDPEIVRTSTLTVLTFTHNWAIADGWSVSVGYLWSVAIEAQFYVLWALIVAAAARTRRPHVLLAAIASVGVLAVVVWRFVEIDRGANLFMLYMTTAARLDAPLVGALAGVAAAAGWFPAFRGRVAAISGGVGLAALVVAAVRADVADEALYRGGFTVVAVAAAVCVLAAVRAAPGRLRRLLGLRPLVAAGLISYSLYVWHLVIFEVLAKNTREWQPLPRVAVGVGLALGVAVLSYRFVERPFLRRHRSSDQPAKAKHRSARAPKAYIS
jgi:peptidoglycan/LPS O-acetylase OafA/YrhL